MALDLQRQSRLLSRLLASVVTGIGAAGLLGWVLDNPGLRALYTGDIAIKTNTAIALSALGVAVLLQAEPVRPAARIAARALALVAVAIGVATLCEHLFGWNLGIDQLLFQEPLGAPATTSPNRMGPPASMCLPLLGLAVLLIDRRTGRGRSLAEPLAMIAILIAIVPALGYVFKVVPLYGIARFTGIALSTALGILTLGFAVLFARPDASGMRQLLANDSSGLLLRRLIPTAIVMPIVLGRLRVLGQDLGWYDTEFGRSLLVLSFILLFSAVTWRTSHVVARHEAAQARAEATAKEMQVGLLLSLESERHARDAAERSNRLKDEFLATLGHELRTPLNAILGWVDLLIRGGLPERDAERGLQAIARNARVQTQLIEELLDMSRIDSGKVRLDLQDIDVTALIESALAAAAPSAEAAGLTLIRELAAGVPPVHGDPARLQQVFGNLLHNAVKFTPRGGRVTVSLSRPPGCCEIAVSDTGVGISPAFLPYVFDRFGQADASSARRYGGLGLGLTIARQLTELHGGTIVAASPGLDRGATFTVRLPTIARTTADRGDRTGRDTSSTDLALPSLTGTRVLLVDDHADGIEALALALRAWQLEVEAVSSVDEAVARLKQSVFDVLITDIGMPGRDGWDLMLEVKGMKLDLPVIALTAFARVEDERRVLASGFARHVAKPASPHLLMLTIAEVVHRPDGALEPRT